MSALTAAVSAAHRVVPSRRSRPACRRAPRATRVTSHAARDDSPSQSSSRLGTRGGSFGPISAISLDAPTSSSSNDEGDADAADIPTTSNVVPSDIGQTGKWPPLLIFVNGKSGGRRGEALRESLSARSDLNALACVDLTAPGASPAPALKEYVGKVPDLRVLVCGGDGTVAWVLQALEELTEIEQKPPVGILPLGTGNDLARVLGWGGRYDDVLLTNLSQALKTAEPSLLDRWECNIERAPGAPPEDDTLGEEGPVVFQNYLGVGVDAAAALKFHKARETNPAMFISAATNKLMYGLFGAYDFIFHSHRDLREQVKVFADGEEIDLPRDAEGVILLNINSYAGGVKMWEKGKRGRFRNWLGSWLSGGYGDSTEERWDPRGPGSIPEGAESEYKEKPKKLSVREKVRAVWRRRRARRAKARLQRSFGKSRKSDGLIDVVVVYGALHLGQLSCGTDRPVRICQARRVRLETRRTLPVQADGQPWEQPASVFDVSLRNRATMLRAPEGHHAAPVAWQSTLPMPPDTTLALRNVAEWLDDRPRSEGEVAFGWESWEDPFDRDSDSRLDVL